MTVKDQFSQEEWTALLQSPMLAGLAVTAADPGGLWSAVKESVAVARSLAEAKARADSSPLLGEMIGAYETSDARGGIQDGIKELLRGKKPAEATEAAVARLREIGALVTAKAPDHAPAYREFVRATAQKVAEAGTEGGFLGFGGEKVSDSERKTLADIEKALG
jgi:hypothetical protein